MADLNEILEQSGFESCEFDTTYDNCERCNETGVVLYFGDRDYWDSREGSYLCEGCLRKRQAANAQLDAEIATLVAKEHLERDE